jgi:molybdenum cofactor synthesis domain-containing protein
MLTQAGFEVVQRAVVPDERPLIQKAIREMAEKAALVVTTGGTGFGPRDVTPEATRTILEREAPGMAEAMRAAGRLDTPMANLSRGVVGTVGNALVCNLPGSPKGACDSLRAVMDIVPHALQLISGDTEHKAGAAAGSEAAASAAGTGAASAAQAGHEHRDDGHAHDHAHRQPEPVASAAEVAPGAPHATDPAVKTELDRRLELGEEVLLATAVRIHGAPPCQPGQKMLLGKDGPIAGTLMCSEFDHAATADTAAVLSRGRPVFRTYEHDLGSVDVYLEPYHRKPRLVVVGATPVGLHLLRWAGESGYEVALVESRPERVTAEHRAAAGLVAEDPAAVPVDAQTDVIHTDHEAPLVAEHLYTLVRGGARFVGLVGSARHASEHLDHLRELGLTDEEVGRIRTPVGLNIGARTTQEIALSILAGLVAARYDRPGGWLDRPAVGAGSAQ